MNTTTTLGQVQDFGARWVAAELGGDTDALAALAADDFTLVGPLGFVLTREQWLDRYRNGDFVTHRLSWDAADVREYGGTAVVIGVLEQQGAYRGSPANGRFRVTQLLARGLTDDSWRLAGLHLSPIAAPGGPGPASEGGAR
jgi:ketosteroid isomerase-like protein